MHYEYITKIEIKFDKKKTFKRKSIKYLQNFIFQESVKLPVFSAAAQCGRSVRILDRLNQPCDHSVNIYHPEGEYLKGLLLYVE